MLSSSSTRVHHIGNLPGDSISILAPRKVWAKEWWEEKRFLERWRENEIMPNEVTEEQERFLDEARENVRDERVQDFCCKLEAVDGNRLLLYWRIGARESSSVDDALRLFFKKVNRVITQVSIHDDILQNDTALLEWGHLFLSAKFTTCKWMSYNHFIAKLRSLMRSRSPSIALAGSKSEVYGMQRNIASVDAALLKRFLRHVGDPRYGHKRLHFVCGDGGAGMTHFAAHASAAYVQEDGEPPIVFFLNMRFRPEYADHALIKADERAQNGDSEARAERSRLACDTLCEMTGEIIKPYAVRQHELRSAAPPVVDAFFVIDHLITRAAMLRALTDEGEDSTIALLNKRCSSLFKHVYVVAASVLPGYDVQDMINLSRNAIFYDLKPSIELASSFTTEIRLQNLFDYFSRNPFFFFTMHNRRCAVDWRDYTKAHISQFVFLSRVMERVREEGAAAMSEDERHTRQHNTIGEFKSDLLELSFEVAYSVYTQPFACLGAAEDLLTSFFRGLLLLTSVVCVNSVRSYKSSMDCIERYSSLFRCSSVKRSVYVCLTGKVNCRNSSVSHRHPLGYGPINMEIVAMVPQQCGDGDVRPLYRIGMHHLVMAMTNYCDEVKQSISGKLSGDFLPLDKYYGFEVEFFLFRLLSFLCSIILEVRPCCDDLSLVDVIDQFRWPSAHAKLRPADEIVLEALRDAALGEDEVQEWSHGHPFCFPSEEDGRITSRCLERMVDAVLEPLCADMAKSKSKLHVILNDEDAQYAGVVVVYGDVLLLFYVNGEDAYGGDKAHVWETTAKLGFEVTASESEEHPDIPNLAIQKAMTRKLAQRLGCRFAIPIFALLREPHARLAKNLPLVDVRVPPDSRQKAASASSAVMKPIVLYIKPYIEHLGEAAFTHS